MSDNERGHLRHPLLILDLDETMISATESEPRDGFDFKIFEYFVRKRPHVEEFLNRVSAWFDLAIWSSGTDDYAMAVADQLFPPPMIPCFVWGRSRCTTRYDEELHRHYCVKDLKKVKRRGFDLSRILIIDDIPEMVSRSYGNHLRLEPFRGAADDRELIDVLPFLEWLKDQPDFRAVEKRKWKTHFQSGGRDNPSMQGGNDR